MSVSRTAISILTAGALMTAAASSFASTGAGADKHDFCTHAVGAALTPGSAGWLTLEHQKARARAIDAPTDANLQAEIDLEKMIEAKTALYAARMQEVRKSASHAVHRTSHVSVDWLRSEYQVAHNRSIDAPTDANLRAELALETLMLTKAEQYAEHIKNKGR